MSCTKQDAPESLGQLLELGSTTGADSSRRPPIKRTFSEKLKQLHDAARDMAQSLGVSFHVAQVDGLWGVYAVRTPLNAVAVSTYVPTITGDGGAAHGRFTRE